MSDLLLQTLPYTENLSGLHYLDVPNVMPLIGHDVRSPVRETMQCGHFCTNSMISVFIPCLEEDILTPLLFLLCPQCPPFPKWAFTRFFNFTIFSSSRIQILPSNLPLLLASILKPFLVDVFFEVFLFRPYQFFAFLPICV